MKFLNQFLVKLVEKARLLPFLLRYPSINKRVTKMAVNKEVAIPIIKVVANPLIGPDPKAKRINAVKKVVTLASIMDDKNEKVR